MTQLELLSRTRTFYLCMMTETTVYITTFKSALLHHASIPHWKLSKAALSFFLPINLIIEIGFWSVILAPTYLAVISMQMSRANVGF